MGSLVFAQINITIMAPGHPQTKENYQLVYFSGSFYTKLTGC